MSFQALTQPTSIGRVLDSGFKLYLASFMNTLPVLVAVCLFSIGMQYVIFEAMMSMMPPGGEPTPEEMSAYMMAAWQNSLGVYLVMMVISMFLYNAMISRVYDAYSNSDNGIVDSLVLSLKKLFPVMVAFILYMVAIMLGFMALLIPGLILMLTLLFFQILIVTDDEGIISSLKTSHNLVWGNYWRTSAVIMIPFVIIYALIAVVGVVMGASAAMGGMTGLDAEGGFAMSFGLFDIAMSVLSVIFVPLMYSIFITQINDLKLRKSGSDLEQRMGS